jgi:hypothetical protein
MVDRIIESIVPNTEEGDIPLKYQPPIRPVTFGMVGENHE